jgi:AraC-like DNA-binding protein
VDEAIFQAFPLPTKARAHIWRHVPATRRPRHFHAEPELNLVTGGSATFAMGEKQFAVARGDLLWWPPGQDHVLVDASPDFDLFVIGVTADFSLRVLADTPEADCAGPIQIHLPVADLAKMEALCSTPGGAGDIPAIESRVGDLWRQAHALRGTADPMHVVTRRTMVSLYQRPELGRSEIARRLGAYPTEISRYFHHDMGLTLSAFRSRLRLLRFIQAVDNGSPNLLSAALGAGFGSYSQCHRIFQQTFACTPRSFFSTALRDEMQNAFAP